MKKLSIIAVLSLIFMSCGHHIYSEGGKENPTRTPGSGIGYPTTPKTETTQSIRVKLPELTGDKGSVGFLPDATAFKMSGNYSKNVAVTLSPEGELLYFPAPTDITADSEPIELVDGWWLNNQGIGPNSVFTKYTFAEYASLPEVPSPEQLKLSIIHGAKVTDFIELPMKTGEALNNLEEVKAYLKQQ